MITNLTEVECKEMLLQIALKLSSLVLDILATSLNKPSPSPQHKPSPSPQHKLSQSPQHKPSPSPQHTQSPQQTPSPQHTPSVQLSEADQPEPSEPGPSSPGVNRYPGWCVCFNCQEMPRDVERLCCGHDHDNCLSQVPEMDILILDPLVLGIQHAYRNDVHALHAIRDEDYNRSMRYAAYRQLILWQFGHLGQGDRRVIASCCVWKIRNTYPDANGMYTGYMPARLM